MTTTRHTSVTVEILSADAHLRATLEGPSTPVAVHSVFHRTVNLLHGTNLLTVAEGSLDDAPASLRVGSPFWAGLAPGITGTIGDRELRFAGVRAVTSNDTSWWAPVRATFTAQARERLPRTLVELDTVRETPSDPAPTSRFDAAVKATLANRVDALAHALANRDHHGVAAAASRLVGLGRGLTPSGDDVLTGCQLVASTPGSGLAWIRADLDVTDAATRTTAVSAAMLRQAAQGRFRAVLLDLSNAIALGRNVSTTAARVRAIGSSSGVDLLSGVRTAVHSIINQA